MNLSPNKYCDPMGDKNVYATVKAINNTVERPEKSVIMAVTRVCVLSFWTWTWCIYVYCLLQRATR